MTTAQDLAQRIDDAWLTLSPQEQRVAAFLRTRPEESALYNSSELARRTGVSKATVSRLFRRLGFAGSQEAREVLRARRAAGSPVVTGDPDEPVSGDAEHLRALATALDRAALREAAAVLAAAPRVVVIGFRTAFPIAMLLRQDLAQARPGTLLAPGPGQTLGEEIAGITPEDAVVVVGFRRRPEGFVRTLARLRDATANIVLIADPTLRAAGARWRFDVAIGSSSAFDSYVAPVALVSLLASEVLTALGPVGAARVAAIDRTYLELDELER